MIELLITALESPKLEVTSLSSNRSELKVQDSNQHSSMKERMILFAAPIEPTIRAFETFLSNRAAWYANMDSRVDISEFCRPFQKLTKDEAIDSLRVYAHNVRKRKNANSFNLTDSNLAIYLLLRAVFQPTVQTLTQYDGPRTILTPFITKNRVYAADWPLRVSAVRTEIDPRFFVDGRQYNPFVDIAVFDIMGTKRDIQSKK